MSNLLFRDASVLVWFSLFLGLLYFDINVLHLGDVVLNKISLGVVWLTQSFVDDLQNDDTNLVDQYFKPFVFLCKIHFGHILLEEKLHDDVQTSSRSLEHGRCEIGNG